MAITNVKDPRDLLPEILAPGGNLPCPEETAYLVRETGIQGLRVWFNIEREKFVIEDTHAPGGPSAAYVMIVQNPDGSGRDFDMRTVFAIRKAYGRSKNDMLDELAGMEKAREDRIKHEREQWTAGMADDLRWAGRNVTPSVANRERSVSREDIRKAARDN